VVCHALGKLMDMHYLRVEVREAEPGTDWMSRWDSNGHREARQAALAQICEPQDGEISNSGV